MGGGVIAAAEGPHPASNVASATISSAATAKAPLPLLQLRNIRRLSPHTRLLTVPSTTLAQGHVNAQVKGTFFGRVSLVPPPTLEEGDSGRGPGVIGHLLRGPSLRPPASPRRYRRGSVLPEPECC